MTGAARGARLLSLVAAIAIAGCSGSPAPSTSPVAVGTPRQTAAEASGSPRGATPTGVACRNLGPGDSTLSLEAGGQTRTVVVHVPPQIRASSVPVPALIAFHGYSSRADEFAAYSRLPAAADAAGFVAVFPQGLGAIPEWHFGNPAAVAGGEAADEALFETLLGTLAGSGCIDMARVFLAGHSQGGGMASHLACLHADRVAGAAIVSGMLLDPPCRPSRPVPIVQVHAVDDPVLPYDGGTVGGAPAGFPPVLAAEAVAAAWAARDECGGAARDEAPAAGVMRRTWAGCAAPVTYYRLSAGGHGWPTPDGAARFDAAAVIAAFVSGRPSD